MKSKNNDLEYTQPLLTKHEPLLNLTGKSAEKFTDKDPMEKDPATDKDPGEKQPEGA
ncbi:MAG: hypothetical protein ACM3PP_02345 [Candidatus Saccharibacteria bacterium]